MNKTLAFAATLALALPTGLAAQAATPHASQVSPRGLASFTPPPFPRGTVHTIVGLVQSAEEVQISIPAQVFTTIDQPTKIKCANANGCTIMVSSMVEANATTSGGSWAICPTIDGASFEEACFYLGALDASLHGQVGHTDGHFSVVAGTHTVLTQVYSEHASTVSGYVTNFTITTP